MKPSIQTLGQILHSPSQYVIPVFQCHYCWETALWPRSGTKLSVAEAREEGRALGLP